MKTKKYIVSNPLVANATGKTEKTIGEQIKLAAPKLPSTSTGSAGSESQEQKPYTPVKCEMWTLPKYYLPDVKTASGYRKNEVSDILEVFKKYPSLDYVSVYSFSTKNSDVNKAVWKRFLELYDQGYIKRIYDKINGYFENGLQNYVKSNSNSDYFKAGVRTGRFLYDMITEEITARIAFESDSAKREILWKLIYDFIYTPETLFQAMYENAKKQLLAEARSITLHITGISDVEESGAFFTDENGERTLISSKKASPYTTWLDALLGFALLFNGQIYRKTLPTTNRKAIYTVALKDNLTQLQVSTKEISQSENEDGRKAGDYPDGDGGSAGDGHNGKNKSSDKSTLLLAAGILTAIFVFKRFKRQ